MTKKIRLASQRTLQITFTNKHQFLITRCKDNIIMTISTRFLTCLRGLDISDREFCRRYGICRTSLHYVKTGQREAQTEWLAILVRDFGVSAHWLLVGDNCKTTCNEKTSHLQQ